MPIASLRLSRSCLRDALDQVERSQHEHFFRFGLDTEGVALPQLVSTPSLFVLRHLNNLIEHLIEQDHRAVKRMTRPMLGFKTLRCARILLAGIEVMHLIRNGQLGAIKDPASSAANPFYSLAF